MLATVGAVQFALLSFARWNIVISFEFQHAHQNQFTNTCLTILSSSLAPDQFLLHVDLICVLLIIVEYLPFDIYSFSRSALFVGLKKLRTAIEK